VGCSYCSCRSSIILLNHTASHVVVSVALYFASVVKREIVGCFLILQAIVVELMLNEDPEVDFL
jgi:hypothetical protein